MYLLLIGTEDCMLKVEIAGQAIDALLANGNDELLLFTRHHMHEKTLV